MNCRHANRRLADTKAKRHGIPVALCFV
ncbi:hypothetical protein CBM2587_A10077 [Cupriavidus taiwanensis]|uniref:Uncharacterized protein n=1 Tax=Cupriavidus taiwanensis TaxID=164546 RepID=A0A975WQT0_9BURK|nr:hypothetical protein CBM2587_A10077 [Cupriavidus taiwanensis]